MDPQNAAVLVFSGKAHHCSLVNKYNVTLTDLKHIRGTVLSEDVQKRREMYERTKTKRKVEEGGIMRSGSHGQSIAHE